MSKQDRKNAAKAIADSAQKIWLAGLGAFAKAQAEGSKMFEQLIREGAELEQRTRKYTKDTVNEMRGRAEAASERLRKSGEASLERMQSLIDERIAKAVRRMAVPTREELDKLIAQIGALNRSLADAATSPLKAAAKSGKAASEPSAGRPKTRRRTAGKTAAAAKKPAPKAPAKRKR